MHFKCALGFHRWESFKSGHVKYTLPNELSVYPVVRTCKRCQRQEYYGWWYGKARWVYLPPIENI